MMDDLLVRLQAVRVSASRRFGEIAAVEYLSLKVPSGSIYGFLGPNGAGKPTTIRLLLDLIRSDAGSVTLLGLPLRGNRVTLLSQVGALVDAPALYPHLTGRENLRATQELVGLPRTSVNRVLGIVGLERETDRIVRGYSLGNRQRLGLALALLSIQLWLALRWASFALAVVLAFSRSSVVVSAVFPWSMAAAAVPTPSATASDSTVVILFAMVSCFVVGFLGCWNVVNRDVT